MNHMRRRLMWVFPIALILSLGLGSCAPSSRYELTEKQSPVAGEAVVFGRIRFIEGGEDLSWSGLHAGECYVVLLDEATSKGEAYYLKRDGSFYWHLRPGKYAITGFYWTTSSGRMFAEFTISPEDQAAYIGTAVVSFPAGRLGSRYTVMISDQYDEATAALRTRYPALPAAPVKSLMQLGDNQ